MNWLLASLASAFVTLFMIGLETLATLATIALVYEHGVRIDLVAVGISNFVLFLVLLWVFAHLFRPVTEMLEEVGQPHLSSP